MSYAFSFPFIAPKNNITQYYTKHEAEEKKMRIRIVAYYDTCLRKVEELKNIACFHWTNRKINQ